jgi:hypothetical protein
MERPALQRGQSFVASRASSHEARASSHEISAHTVLRLLALIGWNRLHIETVIGGSAS